jgi:hypothetical protein
MTVAGPPASSGMGPEGPYSENASPAMKWKGPAAGRLGVAAGGLQRNAPHAFRRRFPKTRAL